MVNKDKVNPKRFYHPKGFLAMQEYLNDNARFTTNLQIQTGARINELRGFMKDPIMNEEEDRFTITLLHTKVRAKKKEKKPTPRTIKLSEVYFKKLKRDIKKHKVLSTNALNIQLKKASKLAGIKNPGEFSSHNVRKTFATWMLSLGITPPKVAQHLGHDEEVLMESYATNDEFSDKDKDVMIKIWGDLPRKLLPYRGIL